MNEPRGLWLYCIIENREPMQWDCFGIHGTSRIAGVTGGKFAAVVSEEPMKKYLLVRDYLIAHQKVNEAVMKTHRVLPVRFCTMTDSQEKIIDEVLVPKESELRDRLAEVAGKEEYGLRARWKNLDKVFGEIGETDPRLVEKKKKILSLPESQKRGELIDVGHLVQEAVCAKNKAMASLLMDELSPLACASKRNNTLGDAMVLNAAFLVRKEKVGLFDKAVSDLDDRYGADLQLKYVGPVPPFNFVEIVIRWKEKSPQPPFVKGGNTVAPPLEKGDEGGFGEKDVSVG